MRFFNTAGPVRPDDHYTIPPLGCLFRSKVISDSGGNMITFAECTGMVQGVRPLELSDAGQPAAVGPFEALKEGPAMAA